MNIDTKISDFEILDFQIIENSKITKSENRDVIFRFRHCKSEVGMPNEVSQAFGGNLARLA